MTRVVEALRAIALTMLGEVGLYPTRTIQLCRCSVAKKHTKCLSFPVKQILWDVDKNSTLHRERGICFEDVLLSLEHGALLDNLEHPNQSKYPGQKYAYLVPYVETENYLFLKTVIPSRKATKQYLAKKETENEAHK